MSEGSGRPPLRIGDAERDAAVERLQRALEEGRLTAPEFDERVGIALQARTQHDLDPLFADLPPVGSDAQGLVGVTGASALPTGGGPGPRARQAWAIQGLMWPLVVILVIASDGKLWWLFLLPMVLGPLLFTSSRSHDRRQVRHDLRDQRQDARRELRDRRRDERHRLD